MAVKVGINGFGRIGRLVFRVLAERSGDFDVVGINDLSDAGMLAYLLKYDTLHGRFNGEVKADGNNLVVNGKKIPVSAEKDPTKLPWKALGAEIAVESTGVFTKKEDCMKHVQAGAKKVLLSAPSKDPVDATIVIGVNDKTLKAEHIVVSNGSCTTNCLAPVAKVLNDNFKVKRGLMTTIHAYTNDQKILDQIHKDARRARAACLNMIPTSTGAAKAIGEVIPELKGKLDGFAIRVPVGTGSVVDLTVELEKTPSADEINAAMKAAAAGPMKGVLDYTEDPIVSSDIIHDAHSSIFDAKSTKVIDKNFVKVLSWYDNEWGFSNRMVDLMGMMAKL
ncbi:MAG TPA: type I glyceraldehyde-3-phosphate dehydrogenase [Planctomycetes bacterium]|nr:type I glyceraldehyde-3-phosphate dehydrogenase [Planctomycetota bacterium]